MLNISVGSEGCVECAKWVFAFFHGGLPALTNEVHESLSQSVRFGVISASCGIMFDASPFEVLLHGMCLGSVVSDHVFRVLLQGP